MPSFIVRIAGTRGSSAPAPRPPIRVISRQGQVDLSRPTVRSSTPLPPVTRPPLHVSGPRT